VKVLYFGTYERSYPRNAQVLSCLRGAGVDVWECHEPVWDGQRHGYRAGGRDAVRLAAAEVRLLARRPHVCDAVIVGYPGHLDMAVARWTARHVPIVFNPLVSLSDTLVSDRARFRSGSVLARSLVAVDRWAMRQADLVVCDTQANARFLARLSGLDLKRFAVCLVGAEDSIFVPGWAPEEPFSALFVGKLIPLHGLETILAAARLAPDVTFRIIGSGQLQALLTDLPSNVEHLDWIEYRQIPGELHRAGCALGVFGISDKAKRVIPNKAFQALACGVPLVTADTEGARELLKDGDSALLVPPGDPEALAVALSRLAGDRSLAARVAEGGLRAYQEHASEAVLGARWRQLLVDLASGSPGR
jgi:glycosyltransferase involved in cell wall biosynthesis